VNFVTAVNSSARRCVKDADGPVRHPRGGQDEREAGMRGSVRAVVVCGALMAAGVGAAVPATASSAVPACSVTFVGPGEEWSNPANWSTGQVPGPDSDVCITGDGPTPEATGTIHIHSLQVSASTEPLFDSLAVSDILIISSGSLLFAGTLSAPTIDNAGEIQSLGPPGGGASTITSPALSNPGIIEAFGTLRLTDNPLQLANGTLNGGTLEADGTGNTIIINGDISSIAAGTIMTDLPEGEGGSIENQSGGNAVASVSSIGQHGTLEYGGTLTGNLVSGGDVGGSEGAFNGTDVTGDYTQASTGTLDVGFGQFFPGGSLSVGQTATLSGTLVVVVDPLCTPGKGATKTVMTFAARNGTFTTTPADFNVTYGPTSIQAQYEGKVNHAECS
jgi:hypothetical protein